MNDVKSNEVEALQECIRMIGGSDEFKRAVIFAAYVKTFKNSLTVVKTDSLDNMTFFISIHRINSPNDNAINLRFPLKYKTFFES